MVRSVESRRWRGRTGNRPERAGPWADMTGIHGPRRSRSDHSCHCRRRSSILSEVSTRARSKLPSGKNILVFGEQRGTTLGRRGGSGGAPPTGSRLLHPYRLLVACLPGRARWTLAG